MTKILIVDDNEMQHELLRCYASDQPDLILLHAQSIEDALDQFATETPDLVFLDNRLWPYADFTHTAPLLREAGFKGKIVVISSEINDPIFGQIEKYSVHTAIDKSMIRLGNFGRLIESVMRMTKIKRLQLAQ